MTSLYIPTQTQSGGAPNALPSGVPRVIAPNDPTTPVPDGTTLIQIGFRYSLNWYFVVENTMAATQIFAELPIAMCNAAGITQDKIKFARLEPLDTTALYGYYTTLARVYYPTNLVDKLRMDLWTPNSLLYTTGDSLVQNLTAQINPQIDLLGDNNFPGASNDPSKSTPSSSGSGNDAFGNSASTDSQNSKQKITTVGITVGAISFGAIYGAAMFVIARRYKRKRQLHRRSSSTSGNDNRPEMGFVGSGSPALMGGAIGNRDSPGHDAVEDNRNSHGSDPSFAPTGRTNNISSPVAAENSLGWN
ncbi:Signaling mucin MSB2 [Escovopsis weberi]|uniref:Signaling mucin MSB2 n=1 Tax=Escovopsis weberi TaxID=150374 RepID=A0A0M8N1N7_ESCWE|nr:Signaling mucin MSB2 [Escovopsis weberi]